MISQPNYGIDIVILTAIPIEVLAALDVFKKNNEQVFKAYAKKHELEIYRNGGKEPNLYHFGKINCENGKEYSVLIVSLPKYGKYGAIRMSALVTDINNKWIPKYFFLIGIAMSLNQKKAKLGDLVLVNKVVSGEIARSEPHGTQPVTELWDLQNNDLGKPHGWKDIFFSFAGEQTIIDHNNKTYECKSIIGTLYSSYEFVASTKRRKEIIKENKVKNLIALEMEACGITDEEIREKLIIAKGISDYGDDNKKDSEYRRVAALHSAEVIYKIIVKGDLDCFCNKYPTELNNLTELSEVEYLNWSGEMRFTQGLFDDAAKDFSQAWDNIISNKSKLFRNNSLIVRLTQNISKIDLERGMISNSLNKSIISLLTSSRYRVLHADSLFITGRVLREAELLKTSLDYFQKAEDAYNEINDAIGIIRTTLWKGYTKYKFGDYIDAYHDIFKAYTMYEEYVKENEDKKDRLLKSEIRDMQGRCLREIANKYSDTEYISGKVNIHTNQKNREFCVLEALNCFWDGKKLADREGNYYRLAESCLSYVIHFSFKNLYEINQKIIENLLDYRNVYINENNQQLSNNNGDITEFLSVLSNHYYDNIKKNFDQGFSLCKRWNYRLLSCLFLKHQGDYFYNKNSNYKRAFNYYCSRFNIAFGKNTDIDFSLYEYEKIRPTEKYRSFSEITQKILEFDDDRKQKKYIKQIRDHLKLQTQDLFSEEFFTLLLDE